MNERIKQLYDQSMEQHVSNNMAWEELNPEKFAELIVRECANVITETRWHLPPTQQQIAVGIKEHFGVNE